MRIWSALGLLPLLVVACNDGGSGGSGSNSNGTSVTYSMSLGLEEMGDGYMVASTPVCVEGVYSLRLDTNQYLIESGRLLLWDKQDCAADAFLGSSVTPIGRWTAESKLYPIPGGADSECSENTEDDEPSDEYSGEMVITQDSVIVKMNYEICFAQDFAESSDEFKANGCNVTKWTKNGKTATMEYSDLANLKNREYTLTFSYEGKTCSLHYLPVLQPSASTCASAWARFQESGDDLEEWDEESFTDNPANESALKEYYKCVANTGFPIYSAAMLKRTLLKGK